jgi:hypothetical protein
MGTVLHFFGRSSAASVKPLRPKAMKIKYQLLEEVRRCGVDFGHHQDDENRFSEINTPGISWNLFGIFFLNPFDIIFWNPFDIHLI